MLIVFLEDLMLYGSHPAATPMNLKPNIYALQSDLQHSVHKLLCLFDLHVNINIQLIIQLRV